MQGLQKNDKTQNNKNCTSLYSNVDALTNKKEELAALIAIHAPMIIALTESMSKHQTCSLNEFVIENYDLFSNENPRRGTFIYTLKTLKNNEVCGVDFIINEMLKNCTDDLLKILCRLFNVVLESGVVPTRWCIGIIVALYKGKGGANSPKII